MEQSRLEFELNKLNSKKLIQNDEELKKAVEKILNREKRKRLSKQDPDFIMDCVNLLLDIDGVDIYAIENTIEKQMDNSLNSIHSKINSKNIAPVKKHYKKLITCFIIIIILSITQLVATAFDYNPVIEMYNFIKSSFGITSVTENGITYTYLDNTKEYNSIEELIENENLNIIYPTKLPDKIKFKNIIKYDFDGNNQYFIAFNTNELLWQINEKHNIHNLDEYEKININNWDFYILNENEIFESIFHYNNFEYQITYTDYDTLIDILEHLRIGEN